MITTESPLQMFRKNRLKVTDFSGQAWCEQQLEFKMQYGQKETEVMRNGVRRHQQLHQEITEVIDIETTSREEHWGVFMLNAWLAINQLTTQGICREIPLIGQFGDIWVVGVADQIKNVNNTYILSDHKTRSRATMPAVAQKQTTHLQVMMYKDMYRQLQTGLQPKLFFSGFQLQSEKNFLGDLPILLQKKQLQVNNLQDMFQLFIDGFGQAPTLSDIMEVSYEWQRDQTLNGIDRFAFNQTFLQTHVHQGMQYWKGLRPAKTVPVQDLWKCRFCDFTAKCKAIKTPIV